MPVITILDTGYTSYACEKELFKRHGYTLQLFSGDASDAVAKRDYARHSVGILVRGTKVDGNFYDHCPDVQAVVRYGVGYDNVNLADAKARGIRVANVQGYANHAVSDHTMALIYACTRGLFPGAQQIFTDFSAPPFEDMFELHDKTLGIIGLGRIGSFVARKAAGLVQMVIAVDPYQPDEQFTRVNVQRVHVRELLAESHIITLHCNLTDETHFLINGEAFAKMNQRPVLINTARGAVVDEKMLLRALQEGRIHSAGLDVFQDEPPTIAQRDLLNHPRVVATGHYAWYSDVASRTLQQRAAENMLALLRGEKIADCLTD
ncbi:C-terminal binding protein [candidate division KSB1 bacterium]|nr:C-terminal binding protein [candidate division KSB1 bacterium]RQW06727.1 MAG: C-terminal binding protein [candidate division KSB1 bacterium]